MPRLQTAHLCDLALNLVPRQVATCSGLGQIIKNPCNTCGGAGRVEKNRSLSVNIPAGVETGTRIRLGGEGEAGMRGGPAGDLYIFVHLKRHSIFERENSTLFCEAPLPITTAALGGEVEVPSLDGTKTTVKIPGGTQSGKQFRLRGKGVKPVRGGSVGDLLCRAVVETPVNLNKEQKALLEQFQESLGQGGHAQSPRQKSWFDGVKDFFEDMKI